MMNEYDLFITRLYFFLIYLFAYWYLSRIKDPVLKKYFIPALTVKIVGAIGLGLIYQFYYSGGDTYNYYNQGSFVYDAFMHSPIIGFEVITNSANKSYEAFQFIDKIYWYTAKEFFVVTTSGLFSLLCINNYSTVSVFFAILAMIGSLSTYNVFKNIYSNNKKEVIISIFFIPSVFFWSSGITKDSLTMLGLGLIINSSYKLFVKFNIKITTVLVLLLSIFILKNTKTYVLLAFIPCFSLWIFLNISQKTTNKLLKIILIPILIIIASISSYYGSKNLISEESKYSLDKISNTVNIASKYHNSISTSTKTVERGHGGSGYDMPEFDGTLNGLINLGPKALIVALYRPFIWEIRNPIMLLSALESLFLLYLSYKAFKNRNKIKQNKDLPTLLFLISFSLIIAISTGLTSGNFGNLSRYRVPALSFFCIALLTISNRKVSGNYLH